MYFRILTIDGLWRVLHTKKPLNAAALEWRQAKKKPEI